MELYLVSVLVLLSGVASRNVLRPPGLGHSQHYQPEVLDPYFSPSFGNNRYEFGVGNRPPMNTALNQPVGSDIADQTSDEVNSNGPTGDDGSSSQNDWAEWNGRPEESDDSTGWSGSQGGRPNKLRTTTRSPVVTTGSPAATTPCSCLGDRTMEYNPVCGTDNQTYRNPSWLACARVCNGSPELETSYGSVCMSQSE